MYLEGIVACSVVFRATYGMLRTGAEGTLDLEGNPCQGERPPKISTSSSLTLAEEVAGKSLLRVATEAEMATRAGGPASRRSAAIRRRLSWAWFPSWGFSW